MEAALYAMTIRTPPGYSLADYFDELAQERRGGAWACNRHDLEEDERSLDIGRMNRPGFRYLWRGYADDRRELFAMVIVTPRRVDRIGSFEETQDGALRLVEVETEGQVVDYSYMVYSRSRETMVYACRSGGYSWHAFLADLRPRFNRMRLDHRDAAESRVRATKAKRAIREEYKRVFDVRVRRSPHEIHAALADMREGTVRIRDYFGYLEPDALGQREVKAEIRVTINRESRGSFPALESIVEAVRHGKGGKLKGSTFDGVHREIDLRTMQETDRIERYDEATWRHWVAETTFSQDVFPRTSPGGPCLTPVAHLASMLSTLP